MVHETFPASGSHGVPLNGVIKVVYCPSEQPLIDRGQTRLLRDLGAAGEGCDCEAGSECLDVGIQQRCLAEVPTTLSFDGDVVTLDLGGQLEPQAVYVVEAPEPSDALRISFSTGTIVDEAPPEFAGVETVRILGCGEGFPENAACPTDLNGEGFVAVLRATAASDEAGAVNVEYRAYEVLDGELIERGRVRGDGAADVTMSIFIPAGELTASEWERICFNMSAADPYGHESMPDSAICEFTPEFSPFGSACAAAGPASLPRQGGLPAVLLAVALLVVIRAFSVRNRRC
jgi:hypothetical protein